jgi:lysozyme family protein
MDSFDSIIDEILIKEGGGEVTNDPSDNGGRTQYGIS